jgi:type II secretory pathway pseudopilin PulG
MHTVCSLSRRGAATAAFTLLEALVAIVITAVAGAALLLGTTTALQTTEESWKRTVAAGMAQQLMDEILGQRYCAAGENGRQVVLGPNSWESQGRGRERYDDIDDYHGYRSTPPRDPWGVLLGYDNGEGGLRHLAFQMPSGFFDNWRQEVDVYYVAESNPMLPLPSGQTSDFRTIEVRIVENVPNVGRREWAKLRRVVAYVPPLP